MTSNVMNNNVMSATKKSKRNSVIAKICIYLSLVLYAALIIFPFTIVVLTSFKTRLDSSALVFKIIPDEGYTIEGYIEVFKYRANYYAVLPTLVQGFVNTFMYIIPPTALGLFSSSLAAYAFSKLRFRASKVMYAILLATMMIPGTITIAPAFSIYDTIGWIDTPYPLMIPGMFGAAACVFFMRQYFTGIPDSVIEAAKIDGVGYFGIFWKMMVPLSVPALIAQGLLGFIGGYNDYFGPMLYLQSSVKYNLQVALKNFASVYGDNQNAVMAATMMALLPTLVIYFIAQDFFIEGIAASGIKG